MDSRVTVPAYKLYTSDAESAYPSDGDSDSSGTAVSAAGSAPVAPAPALDLYTPKYRARRKHANAPQATCVVGEKRGRRAEGPLDLSDDDSSSSSSSSSSSPGRLSPNRKRRKKRADVADLLGVETSGQQSREEIDAELFIEILQRVRRLNSDSEQDKWQNRWLDFVQLVHAKSSVTYSDLLLSAAGGLQHQDYVLHRLRGESERQVARESGAGGARGVHQPLVFGMEEAAAAEENRPFYPPSDRLHAAMLDATTALQCSNLLLDAETMESLEESDTVMKISAIDREKGVEFGPETVWRVLVGFRITHGLFAALTAAAFNLNTLRRMDRAARFESDMATAQQDFDDALGAFANMKYFKEEDKFMYISDYMRKRVDKKYEHVPVAIRRTVMDLERRNMMHFSVYDPSAGRMRTVREIMANARCK